MEDRCLRIGVLYMVHGQKTGIQSVDSKNTLQNSRTTIYRWEWFIPITDHQSLITYRRTTNTYRLVQRSKANWNWKFENAKGVIVALRRRRLRQRQRDVDCGSNNLLLPFCSLFLFSAVDLLLLLGETRQRSSRILSSFAFLLIWRVSKPRRPRAKFA